MTKRKTNSPEEEEVNLRVEAALALLDKDMEGLR